MKALDRSVPGFFFHGFFVMCTSGCMCVCNVLAHVVPMSLYVLYACMYETIVTAHMFGNMKAHTCVCVSTTVHNGR